jgi:hypothetical protein
MRRLLLSFRSILCRGKVSTLRRWAKRAEGRDRLDQPLAAAPEERLAGGRERGETFVEQWPDRRPCQSID